MAGQAIDYQAVFQALPSMVALLTPDLVYVDVNEEFVRSSGRSREQLVGRHLFDVFPDNPNDSEATGARNLEASLRRVAATGQRDTMALQRYDVESADRPGEWRERYWSPVNVPVFGPDGQVALLLHRVEEITELVRAGGDVRGDRDRVLEAELAARARELQEANEHLRAAHAREHEVALALQKAMLPATVSVHCRAAVRYRPAVDALNVCGDWYDLVDLPGDRLAVTVGDVVGHGLAAAGVMGQLRSALSAACRTAEEPARALDVVDLYARSVARAESTTAVTAVIDWSARTISYSSAGHPPPALRRSHGVVEFLDRATDPPLGAAMDHAPRPQAVAAFDPGDALLLYTDGLVERRQESIDAGLERLAVALEKHTTAELETLADALLADLLPSSGPADDIALVIIAL